ncbi:hypothetical protein EI94DRAFT_1702900 [Lactarius quietus]|nr:hypothetical protein EI94DRAFT_1702900 [Lactarius quietus]
MATSQTSQDSDSDRTKAIIVDAQFYLALGSTIIDVGKYFVYANITKYGPSASVRVTKLQPKGYHFMGDMVWSQQLFLIHAMIPDSPHYKTKKLIPSNNSYVGIAVMTQKTASTLTLTTSHFLVALLQYQSNHLLNRKASKSSLNVSTMSTSTHSTRSEGKKKAGSTTTAPTLALAGSSASTLLSSEEGKAFEEVQQEEAT